MFCAKLLLWTIQTQVTDCSCIHIIPCVVNELLWEETWGRWISVPWIIQMIKRRSDGEVLFRQLAIHRLSSKYHFTEKYKGETLQKHRVLNILYTQGDFFSISINTQKASHALKLNAILRTRLKPEGINNIAPGWTEGLGILLIIFYCEHIFRHYYQKIIAQNYTPFSNWENNLYYNDFHKN